MACKAPKHKTPYPTLGSRGLISGPFCPGATFRPGGKHGLSVLALHCTKDLNGRLDSNTTLCVYPLQKPVDLNAAEVTNQVIDASLRQGDFITATGNATPDIVNILLDGQILMNVSDGRKFVSDKGGVLSYGVKNKSTDIASVTVWTCVNSSVDSSLKSVRVFCNADILKDTTAN